MTPELLPAWLERLQQGEPVDPGVTAAETLAEIREHFYGECGNVLRRWDGPLVR